MASLNLSSNGPSISKSYQTVVNAPPPSGNRESPTYGQWAVYSVSTPLVSAFQQDGGKESVLKVQSTGEGELADLIEEFSEGRVQFAYVKVTDSNTGLPKNVLIGWCGEGVPERTKGYFTSHLATVAKFLHGYHVQITARADGDLTPEGIVQRVADSSGSKYSAGEASAPAPAPRPAVASKPAFTPTRSGGIIPSPATRVQPTPSRAGLNDDGWGADAPPVTRTQLEKVQSAYQPTRVNLQELKANPTASRQPIATTSDDSGDVVRGGYQPVGKVDIAAIRKQAAASGQLQDERPAIIKGSYEPVGKVDIAAIRARAQKPEDTSDNVLPSAVNQQPTTLPERPAPSIASERLTTLPKPRVANKFGSSPSFPGTKPPLPIGLQPKPSSSAQIGVASRTFADEGGKTPAQIWAERKAKERGVASSSGSTEPASTLAPIQSQTSGQGEWKSSYAGKSWAPVQTAQEKSYISEQPIDAKANDQQEIEPQPHVSDIRDQFAHDTPAPTPAPAPVAPPAPPVPQASRPVPVPGLSSGPVESEPEHDAQQALPTPPPQPPRSPTPPTPPVRESSPIQIAMPVGYNAADSVADVHEEQHSPPPAMPVRSLQEVVPDEKYLEDDSHDLGRATAEATASQQPQQPERPEQPEQPQGGPRAQIQYDYEKAEDNEIDLREGEYVTDIEMVDQDWWVGVNAQGERGLFPANYVEIVEDNEPVSHATAGSHPYEAEAEAEAEPATAPVAAAAPSAATPSSRGVTATALYDYEAAEDNEIGFPEGVKITNVEFPDDDWWLGEYNGKQGLFPANYVRLDE
ncbi:Neutrophil cytosol factor 2 p67phox [Penicillium italicum]|uniref:Neutrophil cytosol factor 2 p67phox n=1 Tax=Penicillium italicum TaxID=40296 RepID=A0A0A2KT47_PENIT|nr:Neutrophil cytosol factor 2 p67phox [Penicillium italicum]